MLSKNVQALFVVNKMFSVFVLLHFIGLQDQDDSPITLDKLMDFILILAVNVVCK